MRKLDHAGTWSDGRYLGRLETDDETWQLKVTIANLSEAKPVYSLYHYGAFFYRFKSVDEVNDLIAMLKAGI